MKPNNIDPKNPALSSERPLFIDNRDGNTLDRAVARHLHALRQEQALPGELCIATAFFNVSGFNLIEPQINHLPHVRLLLGVEPTPESTRPDRRPGDPTEPEFTRRQVLSAIHQLDNGLAHARNLLPFDQDTDGAIRKMLGHLHSGKVEVRRYESQFLHAKAFIFRVHGGGLIVGSSNLTYAGLRANLELNLGHYEDPVVAKVERWFEELWADAVPYDLAAIYDRLMAEYPPYLIYLKVLYHLYGRELEEEAQETHKQQGSEIPVTTFQRHGIWRAQRILRKYGGVLVADGVGLGKTFLAGEIIRQYRERRQRVLLICPAALRDSTWKEFIHRFQLFVECVSYEELARDKQLGGQHTHLQSNVDEYALVLVDEAHNYRNPDAPARAAILRQLMMGQRRDLLLLTATPVNNSLWDFYHIVRYFIKQDAILADMGVLSIRERFEDAMRVDPFNLNPDMLYPIIDATTVKRTRRFIKRHYENDLIKLPSGATVPIRFPRPVASSIKYDLDEVLPGFLREIEDALMPPNGHPQLTLARYKPDNYPAGQIPDRGDPAIVGLLRSGLLKRFESSVYAFAKTVKKMVGEHDLFLQGLDRGLVLKKELLRELSAADDEEHFEELLATSPHSESTDQYDIEALRADVQADRELLNRLFERASSVKPADDPKLKGLIQELERIIDEAEKEGIDDDDRRQKRKVMVFSFYEDTIDWIEEHLDRVLEKRKALRPYFSRRASVAGNESRGGVTRDAAVYGFAPESSGAPSSRRDDLFDLLLCTDVLAEGMNLQQSRNIINFDLPWNPMRLVQRHGRIDRIGSRHDRVFLRTFFPDKQLDTLLNLELRVRRKLAQAAASIGVEVTPIQDGAEGDQSFAETREEIERLHEGDSSLYEEGGSASAAQSGEEYRQELRKALLMMGDQIRDLPWKAGSGLAKGTKRGHFFCAMVGERLYLRFVPMRDEPDPAIVSEVGTCLRLIECRENTPMTMPLDLKQTAFSAWQRARGNIFDAWTFETDPANLQPRVSKFCREVAEFLRDYPPQGIDQVRFNRSLDAIEAPCSKREENLLRQVFEATYGSHDAKSAAVIETVERIGLEPFQAPLPLPPITADQVQLVCWMAIERAAK